MNIGIISASNVISSGSQSASLEVCKIIKQKIIRKHTDSNVSIIDLREYSLVPCNMCEECSQSRECVYDNGFNKLWNDIKSFDEYIIVCPHYAPIPSKLIIMFEKLEEFSYLQYCAGIDKPFELEGKKVGIIAHGGMKEKYESLYYQNIILPLTNVCKSVGMAVINERSSKPLCFGVTGYNKSTTKVTHDMVHDWEHIEKILDEFLYLYDEDK